VSNSAGLARWPEPQELQTLAQPGLAGPKSARPIRQAMKVAAAKQSVNAR